MISNLQISPKHQPTAKPKAASIGVSPFLTESAYLENSEVLDKFKTSLRGLTKTEAEKRLIKHGPNAVALETQLGWLWRVFKSTGNIPVIRFALPATGSLPTRDFCGGTVMRLMVILGVACRFVRKA